MSRSQRVVTAVGAIAGGLVLAAPARAATTARPRWGLTVDSAEKSALISYANNCPNVTITVQTVLGGG